MRIIKIEEIITLNGGLELIGSNANEKLNFKTDFDYQEFRLLNDADVVDKMKIMVQFQNMFKKLRSLKDAYVVDFKAGIYLSQPLRWDYDNIINGFQYVDDKLINFVDCLGDENRNSIKLDIIAYVNGKYNEISCNYYFYESVKDVNDIFLSLMIDIKKYYTEAKYLKMFKRIYSYRLLKGEDVSELVSMFNSEIGHLNAIVHDIDVVMFIQSEDVLNKLNKTKLNKMITGIYKALPKQFKQIKDLDQLKNELNNLINKLLGKF